MNELDTREYVEYLLKNYNEIIKDIEQLEFEYKTFIDINPDDVIEALKFSAPKGERIQTSGISDKTCKIALIYKEESKRMNRESREEIIKMMKASEIEIKRLDYCIERLEPQIKDVIKGIFLNKASWSEICSKYSISEKTLNKYRKKGIEEIISMFDLRRLVG